MLALHYHVNQVTLLKDIQPNILQRERNVEKADKINHCFSSCAFVSHQLIGFSHLVTASVTASSEDQPIMCHRKNHRGHSGHIPLEPDDAALRRQYQSGCSFAVMLRAEIQAALSPMPENLALMPAGCSV